MNKNFKVHFLNTIWSDSMILERNKHYAFVDTASSFYYPMIQDYCKKLKIKEIDFIVLTHFHNDHYGNLAKIINDYKVNKLYLKHYSGKESSTGDGDKTCDEYYARERGFFDEIIDAAKNNNTELYFFDEDDHDKKEPYIIDFQGLEIEAYSLPNFVENAYSREDSPLYHQHVFSENNNSIMLFTYINNHSVFLGSDAYDSESSIPEMNKIVTKTINTIYERHNINSFDVVKSCHHGGSGTNKIEQLNLMKAHYTIITNTDRWLDNWSTRDNIKLANKDAVILQTDHYQYAFDFSKKVIKYKSIPCESLFITLNKD